MKEVFIMNCVRLLKQNLFTTQVVELENVYRKEGRDKLKEILKTDKRFCHNRYFRLYLLAMVTHELEIEEERELRDVTNHMLWCSKHPAILPYYRIII